MVIVLVSGGFDPLHSGHIAYFEAAAQLGDELWVALNSDAWLTRKKGRPFMPIQERASIVKNLRMVDRVVADFDDSDGSASGAIFKAQAMGAKNIIFANGGDRVSSNTPEQRAYQYDGRVKFVFGVGGEDKKNSSSWILEEWRAPTTQRSWGHYRNLYKGEGFQVKELVIAPHSKLSMQRHKHRSETWNLVSGSAYILSNIRSNPFDGAQRRTLSIQTPVDIPAGIWHQGCNDTDQPAHIIEIWKGPSEQLSESDIERFDR